MYSGPTPLPPRIPRHLGRIRRTPRPPIFLRRFAAVIAAGRNAGQINEAADFIEAQDDRIQATATEFAAT
jgi:hypothetical protein